MVEIEILLYCQVFYFLKNKSFKAIISLKKKKQNDKIPGDMVA